MSDENTLWMGDIEPWMNESVIINSFNHFNIFPINVKLIRDKKKNINRTYCFVTFKNFQEANNALRSLNGNKMPNTNIIFKLNWADYQTSATKTVYVGNLNLNIGDNELYKLFSQKYKSVYRANVVTENGVSKGYGFVTFKNEEDYLKSLKELNGYFFYGNHIKVREKKKKDEDNNYNNINNNILIAGIKNRERNKNNFYDFNKGNMNNNFLNNHNDNNIPFFLQNNINNNILLQNSEKKFIGLRNNNININNIHNNNLNTNNLNQQINYLNNNNINNNNLINDINKINNSDNKKNIINFNTIQNINIINNNNSINNSNNNILQSNGIFNYNNQSPSLEYLLNKLNNSKNNNNSLIYGANKNNDNKNKQKINNLKNKKESNLFQFDNKNLSNKSDLKLNINNSENNNIKKEKTKLINNINNEKNKNNKNNNSNKNSINKNNKNKIKLEVLENIDEITLCKKIHESIKRTFEYHKKMFINNGIKFKSK